MGQHRALHALRLADLAGTLLAIGDHGQTQHWRKHPATCLWPQAGGLAPRSSTARLALPGPTLWLVGAGRTCNRRGGARRQIGMAAARRLI